MDSRRRTLASSDPSGQPGYGSSIPVPASAAKKGSSQHQYGGAGGYGSVAGSKPVAGRMSMAPQRVGGRTSMAPDFAGSQGGYASQGSQPGGQEFGASGRRQSVAASQAPSTALRNVNPLFSAATQRIPLSSGRGDAGFLRTTQGFPVVAATPGGGGAMGRSTLGTASRRKSSAAVAPIVGGSLLPTSRVFKDPRPKDRRTIASMQNDLYEFLSTTSFSDGLNAKTLQTPTTKDFQNIFRFLYIVSDPHHRFGLGGKKFEDEVIPLLRGLGYPSVDTITKSGLQAPGSMHTWPTMVAMLHWLHVQHEAGTRAFQSHPPLRIEADLDIKPGDDAAENRASVANWFEYVGTAYPLFLQSEDYDIEHGKARLEETFQSRLDRYAIAIERSDNDKQQLNAEVERLMAMSSPLEAAERDHVKFERDVERFTDYINKLRLQVERFEKTNEELRMSRKEHEDRLEETRRRRDHLAAQVDAQKVSSADIQRMNTDRNKLESNMKAVTERHHGLFESVGDLEIRVQNASDTIDKIVATYMTKAFALGLMPRAPAPFEHVDFQQSLNGGVGTEGLSEMVPDIQHQVKPALSALKSTTMEARREFSGQVMGIEERLTATTESIQEKKETLETCEVQNEQLANSVNEAKEALTTEIGLGSQQFDVLQRQNSDIKASMVGGSQIIGQRLEAVKLEYKQLVPQVENIKRDNVEEFQQMLEFLVEYKTACTDKIALLRKHAEASTSN